MISKLASKYLYRVIVSFTQQNQVSKRALDNYVSPYKWNNQGSCGLFEEN
jgi:hypothetical protein